MFDDHPAINALVPVFARLPASRDRLVDLVRLSVLEEAAREDVDVIFRFVYAHPIDLAHGERICGAAEARTLAYVKQEAA